MSSNLQVIIEVINHIGWIRLNRLNALNAFSIEMIESIIVTLKKWKNDKDIYMIYITSNHHKAFCAGGDVKSLYEHSVRDDYKYAEIYLSKQYTMDYIIQTYQKPILTYIDGYVFGGGVGFSIGASHVVVSERVKFAMPETKIGFFPDVGASYFLNQLPHHVGKYIGILGPILNNNDLAYLNIADYVIKHDTWHEVEEALFRFDFGKHFLDSDLDALLEKYHQHTKLSHIKENIQSIDYIFSKMNLLDMIKKLDINNPFEKELQQRFLEMSPTAMTFTLEMLNRTKSLSLLDCFKFEQRLSEHVIKTHDFKEGVRSLLIDKDQRFDYKPKEVSDVNYNDIEALFDFDMNQPHMMDELLEDYEK